MHSVQTIDSMAVHRHLTASPHYQLHLGLLVFSSACSRKHSTLQASNDRCTLMMPARTLTPSSLILHPVRFSSAMVWLVRKPSLSTCRASQAHAALNLAVAAVWKRVWHCWPDTLPDTLSTTIQYIIEYDSASSSKHNYSPQISDKTPSDAAGSIQAWWLNGRAFDSRSKGCVFKSRPSHAFGACGLEKGSWVPTLAVD